MPIKSNAMEHREDIGELLKDRLSDVQKTPKETLWERLDNSLEERKKKRRSAVWFWYGSAGILLALLFVSGVLLLRDSNITEENTTKISAEKNADKTENETENLLDTKASTQNGTEVANTNITETNRNNTTTPPSKITKNATIKKDDNVNKTATTENGFTIITTHEYYNSDLDTTTTSHNKQKIDSLVAANKRKMAIKDSIARRRATDSIKLNEARKDSIPE